MIYCTFAILCKHYYNIKNTMKQTFGKLFALTLALLLSVQGLSAQFDKLRYRVEAGVSSSKISEFGTGEALTGYRVGGFVILPFRHSAFSLNTGLILQKKGETSTFFTRDNAGVNHSHTTVNSLHYLQLPIEIVAKVKFNESNSLNIGFGPYLAYAISGKSSNWNNQAGNTLNLLTKGANGETPFNAFEVGLGLNLSYAYKQFSLKGGLELSMTDVVNGNNADVRRYLVGGTRRHGLAYVTLGYTF